MMLAPPFTVLLVSITLSLVYAARLNASPSLLRSIAKTGATALLAAFALMQGAPTLLVIALLLSAAGDAFLSREGETNFLGGLASFLIAHIAFIALFAGAGTASVFQVEPWRIAAVATLVIVSAVFLTALVRRVPAALRLPVGIYGLAIAAIGIAALSTGKPAVILGAILFIASDMLLAWERFLASPDSRLRSSARGAVWTLYYAAQLLITLGFTR